jgi:sugar lactone lactonase YvrE
MSTGLDRPDAPPLPAAPGWRVRRLVASNPLWASNGVAFGPDGLLHVAQFLGGQLGTVDTATGRVEVLVGADGPLTAPDDLAFADDGTMYVVDLPPGLVWRRRPDGDLRVVAEGIRAPDGIACAAGRLFVNELYPDGRLLEIDLGGGPPRVLAEGLALGNAMQVGPDGRLYYPHLMSGEVWRVAIDGDRPEPERVLAGIDRPVAVRFGRDGALLVLSINATGTLTTVDLAAGTQRQVETGIVGPDNLAVDEHGRMFVSGAYRGGIAEVGPDGRTRSVVPPGLNGPFGIAVDPRGTIVVADHYGLAEIDPDGELTYSWPFAAVPHGVRGVAAGPAELHLTTLRGDVHSGGPHALRRRVSGLADPTGVARTDDGALLVAETGGGRVLRIDPDDRITVLANGLDRPTDVTVDEQGVGYVSETGRGRIIRLADGGVVTEGLRGPEGLAAHRGGLYCLEPGGRRLSWVDPRTGATETVADGLALAVLPPHVTVPADPRIPRRPPPFAAIAATDDGLVVGASGDGSVLRFTRIAES